MVSKDASHFRNASQKIQLEKAKIYNITTYSLDMKIQSNRQELWKTDLNGVKRKS